MEEKALAQATIKQPQNGHKNLKSPPCSHIAFKLNTAPRTEFLFDEVLIHNKSWRAPQASKRLCPGL